MARALKLSTTPIRVRGYWQQSGIGTSPEASNYSNSVSGYLQQSGSGICTEASNYPASGTSELQKTDSCMCPEASNRKIWVPGFFNSQTLAGHLKLPITPIRVLGHLQQTDSGVSPEASD